jgi:hypothetical protein
LERFKQREGYARVGLKHQEDGLRLGQWVLTQQLYKDRLTPEQIVRLDKLGFNWNPLAEDWETNFAALERFKQREGHIRVSKEHQEDGLKLGSWVVSQRRKKLMLSPEQITRLNQLGYSWDLFAEEWEKNFAALVIFKQREGHACPGQKHLEDGLYLGAWAITQRRRKDTLSSDQIVRLNSLGFVWRK